MRRDDHLHLRPRGRSKQVQRSRTVNNGVNTTNDLNVTFAYNPASEIASTVRTGDTYAWTGHFNTNVTGTAGITVTVY